MMKKISIAILFVLIFGGFVLAGDLISKSMTLDTKTTSDLNKTGIKDFNMGEINCFDTFCITTISKEGYFKTDIKTDRYKSVTLKNETCESNKIKEINNLNNEIEDKNKQIEEENKLIEEDNQRLIKEYEEKLNQKVEPTYDEFGNEIDIKEETKEIPYPTLRDKLPLLSLIFIDLGQISNDCSYQEKQLKTDEEVKLDIDEQTKSRMNEIAFYFNDKNKSKTKIDDAKRIEIK